MTNSAMEGSVLSHGGVSLSIPDGWTGRVLFLDPRGRNFILQTANFTLPEQSGMSIPPDLPPGIEDRLTALGGEDVLVTLTTRESPELLGGETPAPAVASVPPLAREDFQSGVSSIARDEAFTTRAFSIGGRRFDLEVSLGHAVVDETSVERANGILSSLAVSPG